MLNHYVSKNRRRRVIRSPTDFFQSFWLKKVPLQFLGWVSAHLPILGGRFLGRFLGFYGVLLPLPMGWVPTAFPSHLKTIGRRLGVLAVPTRSSPTLLPPVPPTFFNLTLVLLAAA